MRFATKTIIPPDSIEDAKTIRTSVFQKRQGIDRDIDFDGKDKKAIHFVVYDEKNPVGTARIRKINNKTVKVERVAVMEKYRGQGVGRIIMKKIEKYCLRKNIKKITLDSQMTAKGFYEKLGYLVEGDVFVEAEIPHIVMVKMV